MALDFSKLAEQTKTTWQKLPAKRKLVVAGGALATIALIAALTLRAPTENWSVLFAGLAAEDSGKVLEQLKAGNIPYKIDGTGTIQVPTAVVHEQRIAMASSGLPRGGGVGFEVFDKQVFGTTNFVEQMNYRRALQGELQRTISSLDSVERARVHLAMRERSLFRDDDEPPSASVVVGLRAGRTLSPKQVRGVVHLVSSSIEGLRPERITVVDESGAQLWSGDEGSQSGDAEHELERKLGRRITELLERVVGAGHSSVVVTAELDTTRVEKTEETWDKNKAALRSESRSEEGMTASGDGAGGVAGARGNLPGAPTPTTAGVTAAGGRGRFSETKNYEVSKTVSHTTAPKVRVHKLHVAILIDELADPKTPGATVPRTKDELDRIASLTREAAGLDTERGDRLELRSAPFAVADVPGKEPVVPTLWDKQPPKIKLIVMGAAAGLVFLTVVAFLIARRRRNKKGPAAEKGVIAQLPVSVGTYEATLNGETPSHTPVMQLQGADVHDRVQTATKADAARAARILSAWLSEGAKRDQKSAA